MASEKVDSGNNESLKLIKEQNKLKSAASDQTKDVASAAPSTAVGIKNTTPASGKKATTGGSATISPGTSIDEKILILRIPSGKQITGHTTGIGQLPYYTANDRLGENVKTYANRNVGINPSVEGIMRLWNSDQVSLFTENPYVFSSFDAKMFLSHAINTSKFDGAGKTIRKVGKNEQEYNENAISAWGACVNWAMLGYYMLKSKNPKDRSVSEAEAKRRSSRFLWGEWATFQGFHRGIDYEISDDVRKVKNGTATGANIHAICGGTVRRVTPYSLTVYNAIKDVRVFYVHLKFKSFNIGDKIKPGQILGTEYANGYQKETIYAHTHLEFAAGDDVTVIEAHVSPWESKNQNPCDGRGKKLSLINGNSAYTENSLKNKTYISSSPYGYLLYFYNNYPVD